MRTQVYHDAEDDSDHHHDHVADRRMKDRSSMGRDATAGNLSTDVPGRLEAERFDQLLKAGGVRIERIVSTGQSTPAGEWLDQAWDEWVLLVSGAAEILLKEEDAPRPLKPGDYLFIPAHVRHRVTWTTSDPTIWLAIHIERPVRETAF